MYASGYGNTETVKLLIHHGASPVLSDVRMYVTRVCIILYVYCMQKSLQLALHSNLIIIPSLLEISADPPASLVPGLSVLSMLHAEKSGRLG